VHTPDQEGRYVGVPTYQPCDASIAEAKDSRNERQILPDTIVDAHHAVNPSRSTPNNFVWLCLPSPVCGTEVHALLHLPTIHLKSDHANKTLCICVSACDVGEATGVRLCPEVLLIKMECI
jgi:hypothetical protein